MTHAQAATVIEQHGGAVVEKVTRRTTMLVVGEEGWPLEPNGRVSRKLEKLLALRQQGVVIRVVRESDWLHLVGLDERRREVQREYTPAQLSRLLDLPVTTIRRWDRLGLIRAVRRVGRLPYFNYAEVTQARRLAELLEAGIPPEKLEAALQHLQRAVPGVERPVARLRLLVRDARLLCRDASGLVDPRTGQRVLDFESAQPDEVTGESIVRMPSVPQHDGAHPSGALRPTTAPTERQDVDVAEPVQDWFREGIHLAEKNDLEAAAGALRRHLYKHPDDAECHLVLAETLYRAGHLESALERYHMAVAVDHDYVEAWTQLGCLSVEMGRTEDGLAAFRRALAIHPDCPEAHFQLADALDRAGRVREAVPHWSRYLEFDSGGPWADVARQRLQAARATVEAEDRPRADAD